MKESLIKEHLHVQLSAVSAALEQVVLASGVKRSLHDHLAGMAKPMLGDTANASRVLAQPAQKDTGEDAPEPSNPELSLKGSRESSFKDTLKQPQEPKIVHLDDTLDMVMNEWERSSNLKMHEHQARLDALFEARDLNGHGTLEFGEFRQVAEHARKGISQDVLLNMFDSAIELASVQNGEEMDSVTREAFIQVASQEGLVSLGNEDFVQATQLATRHESGLTASASEKNGSFRKERKGARLASVLQRADRSLHSPEGSFSALHHETQASKSKRASGGFNAKRMKSHFVSGFGSQPSAMSLAASASRSQKDQRVRSVIESAIKANFLFRHLFTQANNASLQEVLSVFEPCAVGEGDIVIKQGSRGDYFYICESGSYDVLVDGNKVHTYQANAGTQNYPCFGELALMYAKPRAASVVAAEAGQLWRLGRAGFRMVRSQQATLTDVTKVLRNVETLSSLRFDQLQTLRDHMIEKVYQPGEVVVRQGEVLNELYVIIKGLAKAYDTADGSIAEAVQPATVLASPAYLLYTYFGERGLLRGCSSPVTVVVSTETPLVVACLTRDHFER